MPFARKIASMRDAMKASCLGLPKLPDVVPSALQTFQSMSWCEQSELWQYGNLREVFVYLGR